MNIHVLAPVGSSPTFRISVCRFLDFCASPVADLACVVPRATIKALDWFLRHFLSIYEFSDEPSCVLRYSRAHSKSVLTLPDGESLQLDDPILDLHFWNERFDTHPHPESRPKALRAALRYSLALLAEQLRSNQQFRDIKAVHATLARASHRSCCLHRPFGYELHIEPRSGESHVHDFFEDLLIHLLRWTFSPHRAGQRSLRLNRVELWISASDLKARLAEEARPGIELVTTIGKLHSAKHHNAQETETVQLTED
jgi:hypothetical protein